MIATILIGLACAMGGLTPDLPRQATADQGVQVEMAAAPAQPLAIPEGQSAGWYTAPPRKSPFANVFRPQVVVRSGSAQGSGLGQAHAGTTPKVVCGLTVWEVDPAFDEGIRRPGVDARIDSKIRRIIPEACTK